MRKIFYIVVHCTATQQNATIQSIQNYWKNNLGWKSPGYHYIIEKDGKITQLQPEDKLSNGVAGYNSNAIHVCYIGGIDVKGKAVDNRTVEQKCALEHIINELKVKYPEAKVQGHRDFPKVAKDCPCFDAKKEYQR